MKIDAMVKREDFYRLNELTLAKYYKEVRGKDLEISTKQACIASDIFVYPKINAIVARFPDRRVRRYIYDEFNNRKSISRLLISKVYAALALHSGGFLAQKTLKFSAKTVVKPSTLIWPCNRKIRIFEFADNYVDSIVKFGFTQKYFDAETTFRKNSSYDFVPKILKLGKNWYREEIISGQALARLRNKAIFAESRRQSIEFLKEINADTLKSINIREYAKTLLNYIEVKMSTATMTKKVESVDQLVCAAKIAKVKACKLDCQIPLVLSHGDLQEGNIWVDKEKKRTYIIDWETNQYRSIWYDPATLLLETRRRRNLLNLVRNANQPEVKFAILSNDPRKDYDMDAVAAVLVLEDILFYLDDMLELPLDFGSDIFNKFGRQVLEILYLWNNR